MSTHSDPELIARVLAHDDRQAFSDLVRKYQSPVRLWFRKLTCGNHSLSDDLAQETFVKVHKYLVQFRGEAKFSTWLFRIAYHVFLSEHRKRRELLIDDHPVLEENRGARPTAGFFWVDLERAMSRLKEAERVCLSLSFFQGLSHQEISDILQSPVGTVKTNILRGKETLRSCLKSWEGAA